MKKDINIKTIWKALRSDKGKKYSFVIFYVFFFIFLFIFMSINNVSDSNQTKEISSLPFSVKELENSNYNFTYQINQNNSIVLYNGFKGNGMINLSDSNNNYTFTYTSGELSTTTNNNNIKYYKLLDIYTIKQIIKNSKLISETKINETGDLIYNYSVSNSYLNTIFLNNVSNNLNNNIIVKTNNLKVVYEIDFDLVNYEKNINSDTHLFEINIRYGEI